jgi:hypothetical protein
MNLRLGSGSAMSSPLLRHSNGTLLGSCTAIMLIAVSAVVPPMIALTLSRSMSSRLTWPAVSGAPPLSRTISRTDNRLSPKGIPVAFTWPAATRRACSWSLPSVAPTPLSSRLTPTTISPLASAGALGAGFEHAANAASDTPPAKMPRRVTPPVMPAPYEGDCCTAMLLGAPGRVKPGIYGLSHSNELRCQR